MRRNLLVASGIALVVACSSDKVTDITADEVAIRTCLAGNRPSAGFSLVPAFADHAFESPVALLPLPGTDAFYVVEKTGVVRRIGGDGAVTAFADLKSRINAGPNEAGLLGMALHPKFAENGLVYLSFTKHSSSSPADLASVIARAKTNDGGLTLDPTSITELLSFDQPFANHNGGHLAFGPDGFLYASFGDGGSGGDPNGNGQNKNVFFGKILRLDVDSGIPYGTPQGNPFAQGGGKPEIFAYGLRNTWRFNFDRETGDLWAGDVGQGKYEEVDKVVLGGNYGWNTREGKHCYTGTSCDVPGAIEPVVEYDHSQGISITGGYVYRGTAIPSLVGQYVYGDYGSGKIWSIPTDNPNPMPVVLAATSLSISSFGQDNAGELYVLDYGSGKIQKIVEGSVDQSLPAKLSETGCFTGTAPAAGLIPYDVASPLWSDGAEKSRWMSLPPNTKIKVLEDGDLDLPNGSVLVKEFRLGGKRIETRLFVRHTEGSWAGYTYEWNDDETEATLLPDGKDKQVGTQTWSYPSRSQCMNCHNQASGGSLGLEVAQLDHPLSYGSGKGGSTENQIDHLAALGLFDPSTPLPSPRPRLVTPSDTSQPVEDRARAYLHSNCSFCHRPFGPGRGAADFRIGNSFADVNVCDTDPEGDALGVDNAKLFVPGSPETSLISVRMHREQGQGRMPPLASKLIDAEGTAIIDEWIRSKTTCGY